MLVIPRDGGTGMNHPLYPRQASSLTPTHPPHSSLRVMQFVAHYLPYVLLLNYVVSLLEVCMLVV